MTGQPPTWVDAARTLHASGHAAEALAVLRTAALAHPDDIRPCVGLAELAALADDYVACRLAIQDLARRGGDGVLTACLTDDPDIALRLAQLWVSVDGRDRASRFWLSRCLERFDWFVPPVPSGYTPESYAAAVAPILARRAAEPPHSAAALTLWRDWLHPTDGPEMRGEVMVSQAGAHSAINWGVARLREQWTIAHDEARQGDRLGLMPLFQDDGAFGVLRMRLDDGSVVARDQIESVQDINLLAGWVGLEPGSAPLLVDVGAGYGRMVHRFLQAFPRAHGRWTR